jgi:fructokinase
MSQDRVFGAVEAGGTKFRVGRFTEELELVGEKRFPTTDPTETLESVVEFFAHGEPITVLGIGCFGPVDLIPSSESYGSTLQTPKTGWSGIDVLGTLRRSLRVPTVIDSDVGAAALAESVIGSGKGKSTVCYVTVGTGIGGAVVSEGNIMHGHGHGEFGHIPTDRVDGDRFEGSCPYHSTCLEGMVSGSAIEARRRSGETNPTAYVASYLAQLVQTLTYTHAPDVIAFGGGVFNLPGLAENVRNHSTARLAGYSTHACLVENMSEYVVESPLGQDAGFLGAALLAAGSVGRLPSSVDSVD